MDEVEKTPQEQQTPAVQPKPAPVKIIPDGMTAEEYAEKLKNEGNDAFKVNNWQLAIDKYS